jgi:hypothetical protein
VYRKRSYLHYLLHRIAEDVKSRVTIFRAFSNCCQTLHKRFGDVGNPADVEKSRTYNDTRRINAAYIATS